MSMRWVLTWKDVLEEDRDEESMDGRKAKARLVVRGYTDPDLVTLRAEAPTLGKFARNMLLQCAVSHKFTIESGDVKTALLQGNKEEA